MELTIEQALQRALQAHKVGKLQDAEALYRAILQAQPKHPDANHNLGVLAVSLNKSEAALPLFKIALEANPNQGQFWLSYVDALIKENQFDNARSVLKQGKKRGLTGEKVDALELQLSSIFLIQSSQSQSITPPPTFTQQHKKVSTKQEKKKNLLINPTNPKQIRNPSQMELNNLLKYYQKGEYNLAQNLAISLTQQYPKHPFGWKVLGALFIKTGKLQDSVIANHKVLEILPNDQEAHSNLGSTLKELGRLEEAETSYKKAIEINPDLAETHSNLGITLQELGRLEEAEASYRKAIAIKPVLAETHSNLGITLQELGRLEEAETSYKKAIAIKPDYAEAHYNFGITLKELDRLEEAEASYRKAIEIKPDLAKAHSNLGITLKELGRLEEAVTSYKKAIEIKLDFEEAHSNLGITLKELGRLEEAETSYKKAIEINPDYAEAHSNLGITLKELGRLEEAETSYKKGIEIKPNLEEAHYNFGNTLKELGRLEEAETSYKKAIEINPDYAEAHFNFGVTLQELGRLEEAEASYSKAIEIKPDLAEAHSNLGVTLKELGRLEEAVTSYKKAIEIKPDLAEAHSNLGTILKELGRLEEAEASYSKAIEIKPEYSDAHGNLGITLQELGRLEEAETSMHRLFEIRSSSVSREIASPVIALLPFGRSGSLFLHSLFDGHPGIATLPGVYFKGWFEIDSWRQLAPDMGRTDWRERLAATVVKKYLPLFDANNKQNVPGKPFGNSNWLSKESGFMEMGNDRSCPLVLDQCAFTVTFLSLLKMHESIDIKRCFELIHRAFEIGIRGSEGAGSKPDGHIFYHIHNPKILERAHFLQHYPQAMLLHLMRNPVQSLESWLLTLDLDNSYGHASSTVSKFGCNHHLKNWSEAVNRVVTMAINMRLPDNRLPGSRGVRLEDVKQNPRKTMHQLADWMGVSDHPALYESSFCGLQYWGPSSKATGKITGFDTKAIDQPVGRLFGPKDVVIFETLFWPLSRLYRYTDLDSAGFQSQLKEIRPWLDEPLEFEAILYSHLAVNKLRLKDLPQYIRLHRLLHLLWSVLDRDGTYQDMVQPLKLD